MCANITPSIVNDLATFLEYSQNVKIAAELQHYRPIKRPIPEAAGSTVSRRDRMIIVRDWFSYAVWALRLKKLAKQLPKMKAEREKRLEEFKEVSETLAKARPGQSAVPDSLSVPGGEQKLRDLAPYMQKMRQKIDEEVAKKLLDQAKKEEMIQGVMVTVRCQELALRCFSSDVQRITIGGVKHPIAEFSILVSSLSSHALLEPLRGGEDWTATVRCLCPSSRDQIVRLCEEHDRFPRLPGRGQQAFRFGFCTGAAPPSQSHTEGQGVCNRGRFRRRS